jgi:hypothetical protein
MNSAIKHFDLLGYHVIDEITGKTGVVISLCFDVYGCIDAVVDSGFDADGKSVINRFNILRLGRTSSRRSVEPHRYNLEPVKGWLKRGDESVSDKFVPIIHKNCGKIAFYANGNIDPDEPIYPEKIRWPDGKMVKEYDPFECGSCGEPFFSWDFIPPNIIVTNNDTTGVLTKEQGR